jgi:hypothetical protein
VNIHERPPDTFDIYSEVKEFLIEDNSEFLDNVVNQAAARLMERLIPKDRIVLFCLVMTREKLGLSPLHITNFYSFMLSPLGKLKPIRTKAWHKSRHKVYRIKKMLVDEVRQVCIELRNKIIK